MKNYTITVNGNVYDVTVEEGASTGAVAAPVKKAAPKAAPAAAPVAAPKASGAAGSIRVEAGAAGKVFKLDTKVGDTVKIVETRPISKTKYFYLKEIVKEAVIL